MIVVRLFGGLGNQLFQYAAARSLADLHGTELALDTHWFDHIPKGATPRAFELDRYPVRARRLQGSELRWARLHQGRYVRRIPFLPRKWLHYRERHFQWDSNFSRLPDGTFLDGYWQSPRYFENCDRTIRQDLSCQLPQSGQDLAVAARMARGQSVSVHVRRGDFVQPPLGAGTGMHAQCSLDYYRAALQPILQRIVEPQFFVFSDDPDWTREHLRLPGTVEFVTHNSAATAFQDLRLMASCQHQIIANSSFSWWGAWLNPHPAKIVVAPRQWFNEGTDTRDLIPATWIRL